MFVAVMETGGFSRAAERLGTSPGQASKLVGRLETELRVQLLNRTTRALSPTEVGEADHERIKSLIEELDALDTSVRTASGEARGRLALTVPETFGTAQLQAALIEFARAYPQIVLDVSFSDRVANVIDEGFDAAIRVGAPSDASLIVRKLCDNRIVVAASPDYLARRGEPVDPSELSIHDCIIDTNFRDPLIWRFRTGDGPGSARVPVTGRLRFSNGEACVAAAEAGLGIVRAPDLRRGSEDSRRRIEGGVAPLRGASRKRTAHSLPALPATRTESAGARRLSRDALPWRTPVGPRLVARSIRAISA